VQQRLQQRIQAARKADGGFTLIELLIVIVILGVLAGVVVFSVQAIANRGNSAACKTNLKSIESAAAGWYADHSNTWPAAGGGDIALVLKQDGYIKEMPALYTYSYDPTTTTHDVVSTPACT
jgi:prepilin-type N-terminal cleavage/methylation domain-containing protein